MKQQKIASVYLLNYKKYYKRHNGSIDDAIDDNRYPDPPSKEIEKKYPLLKHQYSDVFTVHIETTAVCREGDTFDEKKGKTIAYSKAQLKLYDLLNRVYNYMEIYFGDRKYEAQEARRMFFRYANREASFLKGL